MTPSNIYAFRPAIIDEDHAADPVRIDIDAQLNIVFSRRGIPRAEYTGTVTVRGESTTRTYTMPRDARRITREHGISLGAKIIFTSHSNN